MTDNDQRPPRSRASFSVLISGAAVDAAALTGAGSITAGAWQIFHPAAFIVAGLFLLSGAWLAARRGD